VVLFYSQPLDAQTELALVKLALVKLALVKLALMAALPQRWKFKCFDF
jgi:hypothetical protein